MRTYALSLALLSMGVIACGKSESVTSKNFSDVEPTDDNEGEHRPEPEAPASANVPSISPAAADSTPATITGAATPSTTLGFWLAERGEDGFYRVHCKDGTVEVGVAAESIHQPTVCRQQRTFIDWCTYLPDSEALKRTIDVLKSLAGTDYCPDVHRWLLSVESLDLSSRGLSDLRPLATLPHLTSINLWNNQISEIHALASLQDLRNLIIGRNQVKSLEPLKLHAWLEYLHIDSNKVESLEFLRESKRLRTFYGARNPIIKDATRCPTTGASSAVNAFCAALPAPVQP